MATGEPSSTSKATSTFLSATTSSVAWNSWEIDSRASNDFGMNVGGPDAVSMLVVTASGRAVVAAAGTGASGGIGVGRGRGTARPALATESIRGTAGRGQ